jgi:uncharacterized RDD family membrane protein YckC
MTTHFIPTGLPDPVREHAFYDGVTTKRGLAWVVDVILIAVLCALVLPFTAFTGIFFFPALMLIVGFFYRWSTISGRSATWGMRLMAIELRNLRGERFSSSEAFWHTAGYTISVVTFPLQLISVAMMLVTARSQGLTDHLMGTTAMNRPA